MSASTFTGMTPRPYKPDPNPPVCPDCRGRGVLLLGELCTRCKGTGRP